MNHDQAVRDMFTLFGGRDDCYGGDDGICVRRPLTPDVMANHLSGVDGIGVYPIVHDGDEILVKWGCCDIDTGDWSEAYLLQTALKAMGISCYTERSRSKGWHIWVFADGRVPARVMRRALKVAYAAIELPAKEANPKQESLYPHQLGNYVRLPYKGVFNGLAERQVMMRGADATSDGEPWPFEEFMNEVQHVPTETLERWASKWFEPTRKRANTPEVTLADADAELLVSTRAPRLLRLFLEGPKKSDRSEGLVGLARGLVESRAFTESEMWSIVASADRRWGKYFERPNWEDFISDIMSRGYL